MSKKSATYSIRKGAVNTRKQIKMEPIPKGAIVEINGEFSRIQYDDCVIVRKSNLLMVFNGCGIEVNDRIKEGN